MGQKVNPNGIRLGINQKWVSKWFADKKEAYADQLNSDRLIRVFLRKNLKSAAISHIEIQRAAKSVTVAIFAARPGVIIGKKGTGVEELSKKIVRLTGDKNVHVNIKEVRKPELNAKLVGQNIAEQLEKRVMFRRAMKRAIQNAMRAGAKGIKVCVSGRLGGAEIARSEWSKEGRIPLHTFRADIDYATFEALTTYGIIGVKVWIFKGEVLSKSVDNRGDAERELGHKANKKAVSAKS